MRVDVLVVHGFYVLDGVDDLKPRHRKAPLLEHPELVSLVQRLAVVRHYVEHHYVEVLATRRVALTLHGPVCCVSWI